MFAESLTGGAAHGRRNHRKRTAAHGRRIDWRGQRSNGRRNPCPRSGGVKRPCKRTARRDGRRTRPARADATAGSCGAFPAMVAEGTTPPTVETIGAGRYARNKHSLFHARRGQTGAERREFRRAEAGAVFLMHLLAEWCKEWCKGKNIFSMFTGFSRTAAINIGVPMVCFRLMGERRLCVSVRTCGRHGRRT